MTELRKSSCPSAINHKIQTGSSNVQTLNSRQHKSEITEKKETREINPVITIPAFAGGFFQIKVLERKVEEGGDKEIQWPFSVEGGQEHMFGKNGEAARISRVKD